MIDRISIKINNLTDPHFLGVMWLEPCNATTLHPFPCKGGTCPPPPAPYLVWENILELGYCCQAPRTDPPGGLDDVSQISTLVNTDHSSTHLFFTLLDITDPHRSASSDHSFGFNNLVNTQCDSVFLPCGPVAQPGHPGGVRLPCAPVARYLMASNTNPQG